MRSVHLLPKSVTSMAQVSQWRGPELFRYMDSVARRLARVRALVEAETRALNLDRCDFLVLHATARSSSVACSDHPASFHLHINTSALNVKNFNLLGLIRVSSPDCRWYQ